MNTRPRGRDEDDLLFLTEYLTDPKPENRAHAERLCAMHPAKPWEVIAITFTNKAARELRERLTAALDDEEAAAAVWAHTFHTACLRYCGATATFWALRPRSPSTTRTTKSA